MNALSNPLNPVTTSDRQPTPQDRLSEFKRKAVYVPELYSAMDISRLGNKGPNHTLNTPNIPNREIS